MHSFYLRNMYQKNIFKEPNGISLAGQPLDLSTIDLPAYLLAAKSDHIVPWKGAFATMDIYKGEKRFILTDSGHVAGVVNPPSRNKYCHWSNEKADKSKTSAEKWLEGSTQHQGSWWIDWAAWLTKKSGPQVTARSIEAKYALEDAPGSYVKQVTHD
jgi:polyhydroxyalkanoate synthase